MGSVIHSAAQFTPTANRALPCTRSPHSCTLRYLYCHRHPQVADHTNSRIQVSFTLGTCTTAYSAASLCLPFITSVCHPPTQNKLLCV